MADTIIVIFCLGDDLLKARHHQEDRQCQIHEAESMPTAFLASLCLRGNHASARAMLTQHGYIPPMVSKSRVSRRLHRIKNLFIVFFNLFAHPWKTLNTAAISVMDSIPLAGGDHKRIRRFHHRTLFFC